MRAIILAAGRGERMRPLTDTTPKPLLCVRGKPLIECHIEALAAAGVRDIVINTAWLSEQFPAQLGDGARFGVRLHFSDESAEPVGALETAGGIAHALPLLCGAEGGAAESQAFWVVAGDVFLPDFHFPRAAAERFLRSDLDAHLWLTHNSPHHPQGDFGISAESLALSNTTGPRYTWASVGLFRARMFASIQPGAKAALRPHLEDAILRGKLGAELLNGAWVDVGTVERLNSLNSLQS